MTPSKRAKYHGNKSLEAVSKTSGFPVSTLRDMFYNKRQRFECVCIGAAYMKDGTTTQHAQ